VAKNAKDWYFSLAAVEKLNPSRWQELLVDFAKNDTHREVRTSALKKLEDQGALADVAKNAKDIDIGKAAVEKIKDQKLLAEFVNNERNHISIRLAAVEKLGPSKKKKKKCQANYSRH
jgi:hypothetical protein